jgi:hypothetical protein
VRNGVGRFGKPHTTHVSNLASPSIGLVEATDLLLLRVRPRPKTIEPHSRRLPVKPNRTCPAGVSPTAVSSAACTNSG